jgi:mono/diheme cytochrome c family protein
MKTEKTARLVPLLLAVVALIAPSLRAPLRAQSVPKSEYDFDYIGQPMADPLLQKAKETYVLFGCSYCHGLYLAPRGEAPDLKRSKTVSLDTDGKTIAALLRAGIPQTPALSPMPSYSDLSEQQLADLARWIHYARAEGRLKELAETKDPPRGDARAGEEAFRRNCASCHSVSGDLAGLPRRYPGPALRAAFLKPALMSEPPSWKVDQLHDTKKIEARRRHQRLLENYTPQEVSDLAAYLSGAR